MVTTATAFISVSMTKGTMKSDEPWYRSVLRDSSNARFKVILAAGKSVPRKAR